MGNWKILCTIFALVFAYSKASEIKIGDFKNLHHGIGGTVYKKDDHSLLIKGFTYDGRGPDAFFWAGTEGVPSASNGTILPYPFEAVFYESSDQNAPILQGRFNGNKDIELKTPTNLKTTDIKWLSVWCRLYEKDFGHTFFKFSELKEDGSSESEPEKENEAVSNDIDEGYETSQAKSEPEAEPEGEPENQDKSELAGHPETSPVLGNGIAETTKVSCVLSILSLFVAFLFLSIS